LDGVLGPVADYFAENGKRRNLPFVTLRIPRTPRGGFNLTLKHADV
jgi:hypothetical protein